MPIKQLRKTLEASEIHHGILLQDMHVCSKCRVYSCKNIWLFMGLINCLLNGFMKLEACDFHQTWLLYGILRDAHLCLDTGF